MIHLKPAGVADNQMSTWLKYPLSGDAQSIIFEEISQAIVEATDVAKDG